jgi:hypothetical protein
MNSDDASTEPARHIDAASHLQAHRTAQSYLARGRIHHDGPFSEEIETEMVDLSGISLSMLRDCDTEMLTPSLRRIMGEIERPRANVGGGSGEPSTRVD